MYSWDQNPDKEFIGNIKENEWSDQMNFATNKENPMRWGVLMIFLCDREFNSTE